MSYNLKATPNNELLEKYFNSHVEFAFMSINNELTGMNNFIGNSETIWVYLLKVNNAKYRFHYPMGHVCEEWGTML